MLENSISNSKEIFIKNNVSIMVKTDNTGTIEYVNEYFLELSGYEVSEIIGQDVSMMSHPDMPSSIFDHIWESLLKKENTIAIIKNRSKSGDFFWLQARFDFKVSEVTREIEYIYAYYSKVSRTAIIELDKLYKTLKNIEIHSGINVSENYFMGVLEQKSLNYKQFIEQHLL